MALGERGLSVARKAEVTQLSREIRAEIVTRQWRIRRLQAALSAGKRELLTA